MNFRNTIWSIPLLFSFTGCNIEALNSTTSSVSRPSSPSSPAAVPAIAPASTSATVQPQSPAATAPLPDSADVNSIQQDYAATDPLPSTGQVTIRNHIRNLDPSRLIAECPADSAPYLFAESTHYYVQICSQEYDPWLPKYYIGQAKDGSGELRITSPDPEEARQLIFKYNSYTYMIERTATQLEQRNAYLQVYTPNGENFAEALLYLYESSAVPK